MLGQVLGGFLMFLKDLKTKRFCWELHGVKLQLVGGVFECLGFGLRPSRRTQQNHII